MGNVLFVAIVQWGGNSPKRVEKDLGGLTPAWMIELRIEVGQKAALVRSIIPKRLGPETGEFDFNDRFTPLESELPGQDHNSSLRRPGAPAGGSRTRISTGRAQNSR